MSWREDDATRLIYTTSLHAARQKLTHRIQRNIFLSFVLSLYSLKKKIFLRFTPSNYLRFNFSSDQTLTLRYTKDQYIYQVHFIHL